MMEVSRMINGAMKTVPIGLYDASQSELISEVKRLQYACNHKDEEIEVLRSILEEFAMCSKTVKCSADEPADPEECVFVNRGCDKLQAKQALAKADKIKRGK